MSTLATLNVVLNGDIGGFLKAMKEAEGQSQKSSGIIGAALNGIGTVAKVAGAAAVAGIGAVVAGLTVAVSEAMDAEKNLAQLDAVLKSTGGAAGVTREAVLDLAGALQKTTTFSDDEVIAADNLLLTFTQIGKDVFPDATRAVLDMSVALGQDATSSAMQLGKALNDPVKGVTALKKVGVSFTEAQMKQIKAMAEAGDVAGAQAMILRELQTEFGGSAEAAGKTLSGNLTILKNAGLDLLETIGMALLPMLTQLAQGLREALDNPAVQAGLQAIMAAIGNFTTVVLPQIIARAQEVVAWVEANWPRMSAEIGGAFERARAVAEPVIAAIDQFVRAVFAAIGTFLSTHGEDIKRFIGEAWTIISGVIDTAVKTINAVIVTVFGGIATWVNENQAGIQQAFATVWEAIKAIVGTAIEVVRGVVNAVLALLRGDVAGALEALRLMFANIWERIKGVVATAANSARMLLVIAWETIKQKATEIWNGIKAAIENAINGAIEFLRGIVNRFVEMGRNIIEGIVNGIKAAAGAVVNTLQNIVDEAINAVKRTLGIASPSTVFAEMGGQLMAGLAQGIAGGAGLPQLALDGALAGMTAQVSATGGGDRFVFGDIVINEAQRMDATDVAQAVMAEAGRRADSRMRLR